MIKTSNIDTIIMMLIMVWFCVWCFDVSGALVGYESLSNAICNGVSVGAIDSGEVTGI